MHRFSCAQCGAVITSPVDVGESVICHSCNTRQMVPPQAVPLTAEDARQVGRAEESRPASHMVTVPARERVLRLHLALINLLALIVGWGLVAGGLWWGLSAIRLGDLPRRASDTAFPTLISAGLICSWGLGLLYLRHAVGRTRLRRAT